MTVAFSASSFRGAVVLRRRFVLVEIQELDAGVDFGFECADIAVGGFEVEAFLDERLDRGAVGLASAEDGRRHGAPLAHLHISRVSFIPCSSTMPPTWGR